MSPRRYRPDRFGPRIGQPTPRAANAWLSARPSPWPVVLFAVGLLILQTLQVSPAAAVTVSIVRASATQGLDALAVGDTLTIDVVLSNDASSEISGIGVQAFGWDPTVLRGTSLEVAESVFNMTVLSTPTGPGAIGGLPNSIHPNVNLAGDPLLRAVERQQFHLMNAISLTPATGTGENDIGIGGGLIRDGDVHARLTFEVIGGGTTAVEVGSLRSNGDVVVYSNLESEETAIARLELTADGPVFVPPAEPAPEPPPVFDPEPEPPAVVPPVTTIGGDRFGSGETGEITSISFSAAVPEPSAALLYLVGLTGFAAVARGRRSGGTSVPDA